MKTMIKFHFVLVGLASYQSVIILYTNIMVITVFKFQNLDKLLYSPWFSYTIGLIVSLLRATLKSIGNRH